MRSGFIPEPSRTDGQPSLLVENRFRMASPDYIQQVVVPGNTQTGANGGATGSFLSALFRRRSIFGVVWAFTDLLLIAIAAYASLVIRVNSGVHLAHWYSLPGYWPPVSLEITLDLLWF